jgi:hypothetical protein
MIGKVPKGLCVLAAILAIAGTPRADADIVSALKTHWTFDDAGDQQASDTSGEGKHATLGNTNGGDADDPHWVDHGLLGSAMKFDGGQYLKTPSIFDIGSGSVTYAVLAKQTDSSGYQYLISNNDDFVDNFFRVGFGEGTDAGKIRAYSEMDGNAKEIFVSAQTYTGAWRHIVVTRTDTTGKLYVDGNFIETFDTVGGDLGTSSDPWFVGQSGAGEDFFTGYIDEVRIYSRKLTDDDVAALYETTIPEPGTLAILSVGGLIALVRKRRTA